MRIFTLLFSVMMLTASVSSANYAMDPQRVPDPKFAKFFLSRIDTWLRGHIFDYREKLTSADREFIDWFLSDPRTLGEVQGAGFIRSYSYSFYVDHAAVTYGPFRFVRSSPSQSDESAFAKVLKAHKIVLPATSRVIGIGYTSNPQDLEVITLASPEDDQVITLYRGQVKVKVTTVERAVKSASFCPASPAFAQTDRLSDSVKGTSTLYHSSQFEDEALSMEGRRLINKVILGLELSPGTIDYKNQLEYGLAYP